MAAANSSSVMVGRTLSTSSTAATRAGVNVGGGNISRSSSGDVPPLKVSMATMTSRRVFLNVGAPPQISGSHVMYSKMGSCVLMPIILLITLNVTCFRYHVDFMENMVLNEMNRCILIEMYERGIAVLLCIMLGEKFAIRMTNVNHRTKNEDFDVFVEAVASMGSEMLEGSTCFLFFMILFGHHSLETNRCQKDGDGE